MPLRRARNFPARVKGSPPTLRRLREAQSRATLEGMATQSKRVACLLGKEFEDAEFRIPYDRMKQTGAQVDLIGASRGETVVGKKGKERIEIEKSIDEVQPGDYDLLFIPGGHSPDYLRADERFLRFVRDFDSLRRPLATVCHGPQLLMAAGLVDSSRKLTAWKTVQHDLQYTGAEVKDEPVVKDGNWITSRQPSDLGPFSEAVVEQLR